MNPNWCCQHPARKVDTVFSTGIQKWKDSSYFACKGSTSRLIAQERLSLEVSLPLLPVFLSAQFRLRHDHVDDELVQQVNSSLLVDTMLKWRYLWAQSILCSSGLEPVSELVTVVQIPKPHTSISTLKCNTFQCST